MINEIGSVKAILNDELVLLELKDQWTPGAKLMIFERVELASKVSGFDLTSIDVPKGHVRIVLAQGFGLYLAERYRDTTSKTRIVRKNRSFDAFVSAIHGDAEEIEERVPGPWSAEFDDHQSLQIARNRVIRIGDFVTVD